MIKKVVFSEEISQIKYIYFLKSFLRKKEYNLLYINFIVDDLETIEKIYPTKKKEKSTMTKKVNAKKGRKKKKEEFE